MDQERIEAGGLIYKENIAMVGLIGIPTHPALVAAISPKSPIWVFMSN